MTPKLAVIGQGLLAKNSIYKMDDFIVVRHNLHNLCAK